MTPAWDGVFGPDSRINRHHTTGPVAGFLVDATAELRSAGVEVLPEPEVDDQRQRRVHDSMLLPGWLARRS
jgi:hypothetical protein